MKVINLASGSKGNATLVIAGKQKILIDMGLSFKELGARISILKIKPEEIKSIFLTHEHIDHTKGIATFLKKCPFSFLYVHKPLINIVKQKFPLTDFSRIIAFEDIVTFDDVKVRAFPLSHDSFDCVGYQISEGANKMAIATDLGYFTQDTAKIMAECSLCIVESNHDVPMLLKNPRYSTQLKARILSGKGHLSNNQSAELIGFLAVNGVKQILLAHLSEENNTPELAYLTVTEYLKTLNIVEGRDIYVDVASQNKVSHLFIID